MTDFEWTRREYPRLPEIILDGDPGFAESTEYRRLQENDRALPTVVCGAFARYLNRLLLKGESSRSRLDCSLGVVERLAASPDREVQNALVVEVFEHLDLPGDQRQEFRLALGPAAAVLYDNWDDD